MRKIHATVPPLLPDALSMAALCHEAIRRMIADEQNLGNIFTYDRPESVGAIFAELCDQIQHVLGWLNSDKRHTMRKLREVGWHGSKSGAESWTGRHVWVTRDVYEAVCEWWLAAYDARRRFEAGK